MLKIYRCLFTCVAPLLRLYFHARCLYGKDKAESVCNHFGKSTVDRPNGKLIWVHAASIGESTSALTFIRHVKEKFPDLNVLITTITVTSADLLQKKIEKIPNCYHQYAVADHLPWIRRFLDHWQVDAAFFLESEIWPTTVDELYRRNIPSFLINARLSPNSFNRWKMVKDFFSVILAKFTRIMAQSELDRERYSFFSPQNTVRIDNLKYANAVLPCNEELLAFFQRICTGKKVFVAASTHAKEEDIILEAHNQLKRRFDLVTIIIPRHLTRVNEVCNAIKKYGCSLSLRSQLDLDDTEATTSTEIYCIDTFGEVGTFFRLADICFVGGSLVPVGGHNIYEPVALGKPVLHGPYMDNALEVRDFLQEQKLAFEVKNSDDIVNICSDLLQESENNADIGSPLQKIKNRALSITKNSALQEIDDIICLSEILK